MSSDVFRALITPLQNGDLALPVEGRILLINIDPGPPAALFPAERTTCWHWLKNAADHWAQSGYAVSAEKPQGVFAAIFLALPQQRDSALGLMAQAEKLLAEDGVLVIAAPNDGGGRRLAEDLAPYCPAHHSASKQKCRIVWATRKECAALPESWIDRAALHVHPETGMWTRPGLFSWDRVDAATRLLLPFIPQDQTGAFCDPGCSNGVITCAILRGNPKAAEVSAYDVDFRAVEACRRNVAGLGLSTLVAVHWQDFTVGPAAPDADWVVMNPPFHQGKMETIALGQGFIARAAARLKRHGTLLLVANAHLPYEKILQAHFTAIEKCYEGQGFKIFRASL